ncbi:IS630 transposase-related protein [Streptococcus sp. 2022WUSS037]|uniref:IS630 transposase-related protein n=1 Tax=Streptococcus sp. 2022WUSS037 TaxID=2983286 RepID=UPI0037DA4059
MTYGIDFRKRVIAYVQSGHTKKETCDLFGIGTDTLYRWETQLKNEGHLNRKPRARSPRKLPHDRLKAYVKEHPDAFLREIAEHFDCSIPSVWAALKKLNITLKKDHNL